MTHSTFKCAAPALPSRRLFLTQALGTIGMVSLAMAAPVCAADLLVPNITGLYSVSVAKIERPSFTAEVAELVRQWPGRIAVGGGRYSMGGQTAVEGGLQIDMRSMNRLVWFRPQAKTVRVQAGMRWRDLQDIIDGHGLSVKTMQSYANFTIGGSVSVNAHGRYVGNGPVGNSVRALQMVLADGSIVEAGPDRNRALFSAAVGGYGAVGIITEIELELGRNVKIERIVQAVPLEDYPAFFKTLIEPDRENVLHNADLLPPEFDAPVSVTWRESGKPLTERQKLIPRDGSYTAVQNAIWAATEMPGGDWLQSKLIRPNELGKPVVKWLNHEASRDTAELEPRTRLMSTYALQEYFIPVRHFSGFVRGMQTILRQRDVDALNVSIRHSPADAVGMLPWAKEEVFCFVLYHKQRTHAKARADVGRWTRELIDLALIYEGRYYLPYQLHATSQQFRRAYPEAAELARLKARVDPAGKFSNELWRKYL
ncbi:FAD-binding oxidoreductase [Noviherbaspirillum sp. CPCC 100848]|uniref:FAD-binding oxidoreductase n=1 Tax=Noviherbaspirillum album TaxID=3080276 RepID=A0ABU6J2F0_9BURK|nr:FAD-binding oxidoreductase [Noviherbaspirillum sp. CPCC 100848]MEC4717633.1 FAD-binding oxidoreductase [Noviherbaspirillum sp. CPCC 100848]